LDRLGYIDIIAGPDSYRLLPDLLKSAEMGIRAVHTTLSSEETYDDIIPLYPPNAVSSFVSIMRGCNNFCSYCVVPGTRGRERSRNPQSVFNEISSLNSGGYKEIILIGQNVNSYQWESSNGTILNFASLLDQVAKQFPDIRIRFTTSHPKDFNEEIISIILNNPNICRHLHLPVQSGSNHILKLMNRKYTREEYLDKCKMLKVSIPDISITTDIITGFSTETEDNHLMTIDLMKEVRFDLSYMFMYSVRKGTYAAENLPDDIKTEVKKRRLNEIITLQNQISLENNRKDIGQIFEILVEGESKRSSKMFKGRNSQNKNVVFFVNKAKPGDLLKVVIKDCTSATLIGEAYSN
jgi:tRNA-2-methylthio-N6-dimethylallyladenosine synthase